MLALPGTIIVIIIGLGLLLHVGVIAIEIINSEASIRILASLFLFPNVLLFFEMSWGIIVRLPRLRFRL